ncbi:hypothetical protein [Thermococcus barophilus]|uniref:Uncharacterized protein n=1 Tax=Thermococcus barophilus TaxID=55802 RepID=A0A0S1XER7_THEBA|nr:hypothetical protein [Thermococcus barophilus]ALM76211.1 conserved membrane hypothetical protein [Thermococcus barophilus]
MNAPKKLNNVNYLIKLVLVAGLGGFLLRWATGQNITVNQYVEAIASTPIYVIIAIEVLDKLSDKMDYEFLGFAYGSKFGLNKVLMSLIIAGIGFVAVLYFMTGTITMTVGAYNTGILLAAATYALYIVAPETGDDELIFFLWLAATIATSGQYLGVAFSLPIAKLTMLLLS